MLSRIFLRRSTVAQIRLRVRRDRETGMMHLHGDCPDFDRLDAAQEVDLPLQLGAGLEGADWKLEMGSPSALTRAGWTRNSLKMGDQVTVDAWMSKTKDDRANVKSVNPTRILCLLVVL